MVHKRYVKRGGKVYGPYFYESFRDDEGKVKNLYLGNEPLKENGKKKANAKTAVTIAALVILGAFILFNALETTGLTSKATPTTNLTILSGTESANYYSNRSTNPSAVMFTANYTDTTTGASITGNCTIAFNTTGTGFTEPFQMGYNNSVFKGSYVFNYSFDRRGIFQYNISCNATGADTISLIDYFNITNLPPYVLSAYPSRVLPQKTCAEDTACYHNFSANVTDYDTNDLPLANFSILNAFSCISMNSANGLVTVNCTTDSQTGTFSDGTIPSYIVYDSSGGSITATQAWTVTPVNDAPQFNTTDWNVSATQDVFFSYKITASDEENGSYPYLHYRVNATYSWLSINDTTGNISFMPNNSIVGFYHINVSVNDTTGLSTSHDLQINVLNVNDAPNLTIACSPNLTVITTEDAYFDCWINATDIDSGETVNFTANYTFFALNSSTITVEGGKAAVLLNITPSDSAVGLRWVNFTVTDYGGLKSSRLVNFSILNVEEWPFFTNIANITTDANVYFEYDVNASDNDSATQQGDTIKFTDNSSLFEIDINTGVIAFTPSNASSGTYWINITVNDSTDRSTSVVINFTINPNTAPRFIANGNISITEGVNFYYNLSVNFTDAEGDNFTFTDNTTFFDISRFGNITLNTTELDVGTHWVTINATDAKGAIGAYVLNFTVYNVNEAPMIFPVTGTNATEGQTVNFNVSANDSDLLNSANNENLTFTFNYSWIESTKANQTTARVYFTLGPASSGFFWVNVTVNDTANNAASTVFYMNIINSVDAPKFTFVCDNNKTISEDQRLTCSVNATDADASTSLTFTANYSFFLMNNSAIATDASNTASSLVNFTPTYQNVGNFSINISVTDGVYINTTIFYLNISSVNDAPNITTRGPVVGYTTHSIRYDINATDEESGSDSLTGNLTFAVNDSRFTIDKAGTFEFSPNSTQNATYWVNVTVNDTQGLGFSYVFNVTVYRNTAPTCTLLRRMLTNGTIVVTTPPTNYTMVENETTGFLASCSDAEGDTIYYNWFWNGVLNVSSTTATSWNYTASLQDRGEKNNTLLVTDLVDNTSYYWNVSVSALNIPPTLLQNIPNITSGWFQNSDRSILLASYFSDSNNDTISYDWYYVATNETFNSISSQWSVQTGTWNVSNNVTNYLYNQSATSGISAVSYGTTSYAEINSFEVKIRAYGNKIAGVCFRAQGSNCSSSYRAYIDGTNSKLVWDMQADGSTASSNNSADLTISDNIWYWLKVTARGNSTAVYYSNNSATYTLAYNVTTTNYTSGKALLFTSNTRADFDDVLLKDHNIANFTLSLNTNASNLTFTPATDFTGEQPMRITAYDGNGTTESNQFYLTVYHSTPAVETVTSQVAVSGGSTTVTQVASLDIIVPSIVTLNPLTKTLIPVILNNSGRVPLNTINLKAFTNQSLIKLNLDQSSWGMIEVGKQVNAVLEVEAGLLAAERYVIELTGTSGSPQLSQTAKINIDVREREAALKTQLKENIQFTRDLFLQNPECLELTELLDKAQNLYDEGKYQEGLDLVKTANEGCKNFLAKKEFKVIAAAKNYFVENWKIITAELAGLVITILLIIYHFKRRKFRQKAQFA